MTADSEQKPIGKEKKIQALEYGFLGFILIIMTVLVLAQVYVRFFMQSSITWSEELVRFLMIWMTFLGAVIALRQNIHIQIDNVIVRLSPKIKMIFLIIRTVVMVLFLGLLVIGSFSVLEIAGFQTSPGMSINMSYVYSVIPVSASLMALISLIRLWTDIRQVKLDTKSQINGGNP